ncbi:hypothetical protein ABIC55_003244 [Sporosarcina psychrophila]|uniref:Uncharacterized protein n=1 Tax=Sporosarcina psychrophila TaxID=1476 RepID=A0ABV2KB63_SPOPS
MTDWGLFWLYVMFLAILSVTGYVWNAIERMKAMKKGR